jgi:serine/threonine protein kinase
MEELSIKTIKDVNGIMYVLDSILGQGGQGMVCKTKDSTIAVKFVLKNEQILTDEKYYEIYKNKINDVVVMNIDSDINLCHPYTMLEKPYCGYVMHMLSDLKPISNLIYDQNIDGNLNDYFRNTNGLKKRIEVLIELSRTLARLHSKGIVYCDISPNNVFYSDIDNFSKVWIIDCDNLKYTGDVKSGIFTPGFVAPEVASNQSSNTIFSDCFSFAVLAFRV